MNQVLRYLVPIVTLVVLLGRSVATFAAAGPVADVHCCCPDPSTCKCDHGKPGGDNSTMKRCHGGEHFVTPSLEATELPPTPITEIAPQAMRATVHVLVALSDDRTIVPEKPPF